MQMPQDQLPKQARAVQLRQFLPGQAPKRSALARGSMIKQLPMHLQVSRMLCLSTSSFCTLTKYVFIACESASCGLTGNEDVLGECAE